MAKIVMNEAVHVECFLVPKMLSSIDLMLRFCNVATRQLRWLKSEWDLCWI